jgi:hypothetical protein
MRNWVTGITLLGLMTVVCAGCAFSPRQRPIEMGPAASGVGTVEYERRLLEGSWTLQSATVYDAAGTSRPAKASGLLTYDKFGNMTVQGSVADEQGKTSIPIDFSGRIVIDPAKHEFHSADVAGEGATAAALAPVSTDKLRRYELAGDMLTVTYQDTTGNPTAVLTWRRVGT